MRKIYGLLAGLALTLSGCGFLPASGHQTFTVVGEIPPQPVPATGFHNADAAINDTLAKSICADGYEKLTTKTRLAQDDSRDQESYDQWQVRCATYGPSLF